MKLNYKRTVCVGFAFFLICTFWQAYDTIVPKILTDRFGMSQTLSGFIMAIDNILALFMLPLFGVLSDKCRSKMGRRTPFILFGTIIACAALVGLSFVDSAQLKKLDAVSDVDSQQAREIIYDYDYSDTLLTPDNEEFVLKEKFTREQFASITSVDKETGSASIEYTSYVVPARQAYIHEEITGKDPSTLIIFIAVLLILLISMATFRTPAVALMPDVTIKPLRSKANAVINLMGTIGGSLVLGLGMILATGKIENTYMNYTGYFCIVAGIMAVCLTVFLITVREPRFAREMEESSRRYGIDEEDGTDENAGGRKLSRGEMTSLVLLLASVVFWFFGYNAVTSKYSVYAGNILDLDYNSTLLVANVAALVSYIPVGIIASKVGRKKTIIAGVIMLCAAFATASFLEAGTPLPVMMAIFAVAGIGWATINVNSFPMVVELARGGKVGTYTGYYYTASMAAQTLTPVLSGFLMDKMGMKVLFPYAAIFAGCAIVTMIFVRHGDSKPMPSESKLEGLDVDM
ncbi:MAG: MFS transporter [Clostridia bacterium]|nr:MFS transporter [Clostridia bacterium]